MGIKERQERDRESVQRAILDAARELFVSEGYSNVSMRKIAERVEYSPAALYGYFPSKDDIFFALAEEGFRQLHAGAAADASELDALPPLDRLREKFWRLYRFSCDQPQYFALMFVDRTVPRVSREYERLGFAREIKTHMLAEVQQCVDAGLFPGSVQPMVAFRMLTTGLLGVAVMRLSDRLGPAENADNLARDVLNVTLAGLQTGVTFRSTSDLCSVDDNEGPAEAGHPVLQDTKKEDR
jgi:AcrR family transcriptional regulator